MNYSRHQTKHTTCSLKSLKCGPIFIKAVKNLWMNRITSNQPISEGNLFCFQRKISRVFLIHLAKCGTHFFSGFWIFAIEEQSATYYFKTLICSYRFPNRFHTAKGMLDGFQCSLSGFTANFNIRFRNRRNNNTIFACTCSFSQFLNKRNKVVIRASRQSVNTIDFLRISHKLVH